MPTEIDAIVENFPHPTLTPIEGIPSFASIKTLHLQLNANAASFHSNLGNGQLGLLALVLSQETYNNLSNVPFDIPQNPGPVAIMPAGQITQRQASDIRANFDEDKRVYREYHNTDKALKSQLITAVDEMYIKALSHRITGFAQITTRQIIVHLYDNYGKLSPQDLKQNNDNMMTPYDVNTPIETLFEQIEEAVDIASEAGAPYNQNQILNTAYTLIYDTNSFPQTCREWRRLPEANKTWPEFKTMFSEAHKDYRTENASANNRYHAANATFTSDTNDDAILPEETQTALANLVAATASDRAVVAALTTANECLSAHVTDLTKQLTEALAKIAALESTKSKPAQKRNKPREVVPLADMPYCWSHGFKVARDGSHTSKTCKYKKRGHCEEATSTNRMGGYEYGLPQQE